MKNVYSFLIVWLVLGFTIVRGQDVEYKLNPRTGKFDMIRTAKFIQDNSALTDTSSELIDRTIYVSMTTDPQTPGSDVTGNGTNLKPFATIKKAINSIKKNILSNIIIQIDSGLFDLTSYEYRLLADKKSTLPLSITGTFSLIKDLSTYGYKVPASDLMAFRIRYPSLLDSNALKKKFIKLGTNYIPIFGNNRVLNIGDSVTLYLPVSISAGLVVGGIYDPSTILEAKATITNSIGLTNFPLVLALSNLRYKSLNISLKFSSMTYSQCLLEGLRITTGISDYLFQFANSTIVIQRTYLSNTYRFFTGNTSYLSLTAAILFPDVSICTHNFYIYKTDLTLNGTVIGGASYAYSTQGNNTIRLNGYQKYVPLDNAINLYRNYGEGNQFYDNSTLTYVTGPTAILYYPSLMDISTTFANSNYIIDYSKIKFIYGGKFNNYYLHLTGRPTMYVNPSRGYACYIKGIDFPEYEQNITYTLSNNSTDSISIGDLTYNRSITIDYSITRNGQYRFGTLKVLNIGTTFLFDPGDYIESSDIGITFNGVYRSGTSNILKLKWTSTSTGYASTCQIDYKRQKF